MDRVSSSLTIVLRIVLPTMWLAAMLSLIVLLSYAVSGRAQIFSHAIVWIILLILIGISVAFIYFFLWRFYRIDMDRRFIYISDYFKTYKYPFHDIDSIKGVSLLPDRIFRITLKSKGSFGKSIYFLASQKLWKDFVKEHPEQLKDILIKKA